jgi:transposase
VVRKEETMNKKLQKVQLDAALVAAIVEDSHKSYLQLAREFGVSINYVTGVVQRNSLRRKRGRGSPAWKFKKQTDN